MTDTAFKILNRH